jgi:endonuclease/exonuclease/phosphatase family metal-dependent hydrolase
MVLGDFNADEGNPALRALVAEPRTSLRSAYRDAHPDGASVGTYHGFRGDSAAGMIDQILVDASWTVEASGIDRRRFGALWASDHFAVWAILRRD